MKIQTLSLLLAPFITGCFSSSSDSLPEETPPKPSFQLAGVAINQSYLSGDIVCVDGMFEDPCSRGYSSTVKENGQFSISIPESVHAELENYVVSVLPEAQYRSSDRAVIQGVVRPSNKTVRQISPRSSEIVTVVVSPFTTELTNIIQFQDSTMKPQAKLPAAEREMLDRYHMDVQDADILFGDYIDEQRTELINKARHISSNLARAAELESDVKAKEGDDWNYIKAISANVWQHSYYTQETFERYEEKVTRRNYDAMGIIASEHVTIEQWFVDENSLKTGTRKSLVDFKHSWNGDERTTYTYFERDLNQDGESKLLGQQYSKTEVSNVDGAIHESTFQVFNESNPADERWRGPP